MNQMTQAQSDNQLAIQSDPSFLQAKEFAEFMASSQLTIPEHLRGKPADCFAIVGQAKRWGLDPFAVASKTFFVNGMLAYQAQLIIAVVNSRAPLAERMTFSEFGDWSKFTGKMDSSPDIGVVVSALIEGEVEPRELRVSMAQVGKIRNSPLWNDDPRQQLKYLAAKKWARLNCPDVILGMYTADELESSKSKEKDVTPKNNGSASLVARLKQKDEVVIDNFDISTFIDSYNGADSLEQLSAISSDIKKLKEKVTFSEDDQNALSQCYIDNKYRLTLVAFASQLEVATTENIDLIKAEIDKFDFTDPMDKESLDIIYDNRWKQIAF